MINSTRKRKGCINHFYENEKLIHHPLFLPPACPPGSAGDRKADKCSLLKVVVNIEHRIMNFEFRS
jgi:hypothetical protein